MRNLVVALCCVGLVCACAAIPEKNKALLAEAPDCQHPDTQIAALEKIKPNGFKRTLTALDYTTPNGLIGGIVHSDFKDRNTIISGKYGKEIDEKVALIRTRCNVSLSAKAPARNSQASP